jgi:HD-GYP domain-containing protein (c-di-GMP phosphodiesterase class II)
MSAVVRARDDRDSLGAALAALNLIVLRRETDGRFRRLNTAPDWSGLLGPPPEFPGGGIELARRSGFLDNFLIDAEALWLKGEPGRIHSGLWLETDARGTDWPLEAQAVVAGADQFLIIQQLSEDYAERVQVMQSARNHLLAEEALEREVRRRTAVVRQREEEIAIRLLAAAGTRDEETGSHVRRIGLFSAALGSALGWDPVRTADIRVAAPMHDIGKIGIPDKILQKPGKLTPEEYKVMQQHTLIGANMLGGSDIPVLRMSRDIALCHHERWDGTGYPHGLHGERIPIEARIVAIVDVYDAMINRRVYKEPIPEAEVLATMAEASGRHFDPQLFALFLHILPEIQSIRASVPE